MTRDGYTRRGLLCAVASGTAAIAGCGYQPGGGELAWTESIASGSGLTETDDERWVSDGTVLYRIRNRRGTAVEFDSPSNAGFTDVDDASITAYNSRGAAVWHAGTDHRYRGEPVAVDGRVSVPLVNGRVAAYGPTERDGTGAGGTGRTRSDGSVTTLWTTEWYEIGAERGTDPERGETAGNESDGTDWRTDGERTGSDADGERTDPAPPLALTATSDLVVGISHDRVIAFDAATGAERFALEAAAIGVSTIDDGVGTEDGVWIVGSRADGTPVAIAIDTDGTVRTERPLPSDPEWLETAAESTVLIGIDGDLLALEAAGGRRFSISLGDGGGTPLVAGTRLYYADENTGALVAVDLEAGERAWRRDGYSWYHAVADVDGVYARGTTPDMDDCGLFALTASGESWWEVPMLEDVGCRGSLHLVDDRLVVAVGDELYGFHAEPGVRHSVL